MCLLLSFLFIDPSPAALSLQPVMARSLVLSRNHSPQKDSRRPLAWRVAKRRASNLRRFGNPSQAFSFDALLFFRNPPSNRTSCAAEDYKRTATRPRKSSKHSRSTCVAMYRIRRPLEASCRWSLAARGPVAVGGESHPFRMPCTDAASARMVPGATPPMAAVCTRRNPPLARGTHRGRLACVSLLPCGY